MLNQQRKNDPFCYIANDEPCDICQWESKYEFSCPATLMENHRHIIYCQKCINEYHQKNNIISTQPEADRKYFTELCEQTQTGE